MTRTVLIVGAGPGGLASAMLLARAGVRVKLFERRDRVGGRTSRFGEKGYSFDLGPTFFLYPRVLRDIYASVGRRLDEEVDLIRLDPQYHLVFGSGGDLRATPDVEAMERAMARIAPADAARLRAYLSENREKLERFRPILEQPFHSWRDLLSPELIKLLPLVRPWSSIDRDLSRFFKDERLRLGFSFQSKYLGMSPFRCPSLFTILSFLEYEHGVFHPKGGCAAVSESMARVAEDLGVEIHLDEPVEELFFRGRTVTGLRTSSGVHHGDAVVINADFARAMQRLVPDRLRRRWNDRALAKKRYSCSTFMMYLGIEGRYDDVEHHTIHLARDYQRNLDDIEKRGILSDDPSFYVQNASVTDPTLAPEGHSTLYVLVPVPNQTAGINWSAEKARFRALTLRQLQKIGIHGVEERIRYERVVTPDDWSTSFEIHQGATFNLAHTLRQMLHLRPGNRFRDVDGIYIVGGGTHPGSGLPVIYEGARISSRLVLQDLGLSTAHLDEIPVPAPRRAARPRLERVA